MKIIIIGASGFVGQSLFSGLRLFGNNIVGTYLHNNVLGLKKLDITDSKAVNAFIEKETPEMVINVAGIGRPFQFQSNPDLGREINVEGTMNVASACKTSRIPLIYISSTFVFDGAKQTPYIETDITSPINLYGHSKVEAENIVRGIHNSIILRTDMMYGYNGNNLNNGFFDVIYWAKNSLVLNSKYLRQPLWADDLVTAIIKLCKNKDYGIFHLAGDEHITQYDLGKKIEKIIRAKSIISLAMETDNIDRPSRIFLDTAKAKKIGIKFTSVDEALSKMVEKLKKY